MVPCKVFGGMNNVSSGKLHPRTPGQLPLYPPTCTSNHWISCPRTHLPLRSSRFKCLPQTCYSLAFFIWTDGTLHEEKHLTVSLDSTIKMATEALSQSRASPPGSLLPLSMAFPFHTWTRRPEHLGTK